MLAAHPDLADIKNNPGTFIRGFDAWFKDSTGFRKQLLALYNVMGKNQWLNGIYYTNGSFVYLVGEQGHHYFADMGGSLILVFQGKKILSDKKLVNMADKLEEVKTYLDKKNIPLVVMFCTMKESVYPEFYPKAIKRGPEPIQLDLITGYLRKHTSLDVFNIRQALLAEKDNYLLYYKVDTFEFLGGAFTHYNEIGAFFAYRELMKHINKYFPELVSYGLNDITINYDEKAIPHVSLKAEKTYKELAPSFFDGVNFDDIDFFGRAFNNAYENRDTSLPVVLFLRTSFSSEVYTGKFIAQHFGKTIMTHFVNMEHIEEYVTRFKPDIVVFEAVERQLEMFADRAAKIPELP